jgi:hypothetical protein
MARSLRLQLAIRPYVAARHEPAVLVDVLEPVGARQSRVGDPRKVVVAGHALGIVLLPRVADGEAVEARRVAVGGVLQDRAGIQDLLVEGGLELDLDAVAVRIVEGRERRAARCGVGVGSRRGHGRRGGRGRGGRRRGGGTAPAARGNSGDQGKAEKAAPGRKRADNIHRSILESGSHAIKSFILSSLLELNVSVGPGEQPSSRIISAARTQAGSEPQPIRR